MTAPRPRARRPAPKDHTPERVLAVAAVAALLLVAVVSATLIVHATSGGGDATPAALAPTPTRTPSPTPTPRPKPTPVPLTAAQRTERAAAVSIVDSRGFSVVRLADYDPRKTLRVLIGRQRAGGAELAFFFVDGDYIGNDTTDPSAKLRVAHQGDLTVTLAYGIYAPGDAPAKPTGTPVKVRFRWDGTRLSPVDAIPDPSLRTPGRQTQ
jgi:hypothetical protein